MSCNFKEIDWGPDEAKNDHNLEKYFVKIPQYQDILLGKKRYIIGRKGTGKTAILESIRIESEKNPLWQFADISLKNFPLSIIRNLRDKNYRDKSQYVPAWSFLLLIELAKMICSDESSKPFEEVFRLKEFLISNRFLEGTITETATFLEENEAKVNVASEWLGAEYTKKYGKEINTSIVYHRVLEILIAKINRINSDSTYFLLVDELDEGYKAKDSNIRLLILSLLWSIENLALLFKYDNIRLRCVLALRSDIYETLEDNDLNKYDDYLIKLIWNPKLLGNYSILEIVNKRIVASYPQLADDENPWLKIANQYDRSIPIRRGGLWEFMYNRTYERPRDIIKFLKICQNKTRSRILDYSIVKDTELDYSTWLWGEIRDELHSHLAVWQEALQAITRVNKGKFTREEYTYQLQASLKIVKWLEANYKTVDDLIEILFDYSIIGNYYPETERWIFKYKDTTLAWDRDANIIVHFGLVKKLRIRTY